jgi:hypothetical protein
MDCLQQQIDARFTSIEELLSEKASKQSVAQALHRKVNKPENDEILAQKADLVDIQRILSALDHKVDRANFQSVIRGIESRTDN